MFQHNWYKLTEAKKRIHYLTYLKIRKSLALDMAAPLDSVSP